MTGRFLIRPVEERDLGDLKKLAASIKGLTTLPDDEESLTNKIHDSLKAFGPHVRKPGGEAYLFVLEDAQERRVIGTSGAVSKVGGFDPFYTYKIKTEIHASEVLNIRKEAKVLHLHVNHNGPTEIGSLLVDPRYRRHGLGRLVSLSRFLFMAEFPKRFDKTVISELRGVVSPVGKSPFWECVGRHFFGMDFFQADALTGTGNKAVIEELMPKHPIYVDLLPREAQAVIGEVHDDTKPARVLLEKEGFTFHEEVDIFDAGPTVSASLKNIRTVAASKKMKIAATANVSGEREFLISNAKLEFRCVTGRLRETAVGLELDENAMQSLKLKPGDEARYVTLK